MPRYLDLCCKKCGAEVDDLFVMRVPMRIIHLINASTGERCGGKFDIVYRPRRTSTPQWSDKDSITIFKKPDGTFSYPMHNSKPTPAGCERLTIKSHAELRAFERQAGVTAHISGYDAHSGHGLDDAPPEHQPHRESERQRYERFRESTRGLF